MSEIDSIEQPEKRPSLVAENSADIANYHCLDLAIAGLSCPPNSRPPTS